MQRFKIWPKRPNPLFEGWLDEWIKEAKAKDSEIQHQFKKALNSLKKYPLALESGKDCIILQHFGSKLCDMLEKKFCEHKETNYDKNNHTPVQCGLNEYCVLRTDRNDNKNQRQKKKPNEPSISRYAILFILDEKLRKDRSVEYIGENQLVRDDRLRLLGLKPSNIVSTLSTMTVDGSIVKLAELSEYKLTEYGLTVVDKFKSDLSLGKFNSFGDSENVADFLQGILKDLNEDNERTLKLTTLELNSFDVILLVDNNESPGGKKKIQDETIHKELTRLNIPFEIRHMKIGDFTWIARRKSDNAEFILPYLAERKRMDDLVHSIKDGRFHEQKFRMKQSGIENLIYILEHHEINHQSKITLPTLFQASINSVVQDGFIVKYTRNHKDTISYLATMTEVLQNMYNDVSNVKYPKASLSLMEFEEFNKAASKSKELTAQDLFIRQLLQLKGMTIQKALAIVKEYPTFRLLMMAFREAEPNGAELLAPIIYGEKNKAIGSAMSKLLHRFYTSRELK